MPLISAPRNLPCVRSRSKKGSPPATKTCPEQSRRIGDEENMAQTNQLPLGKAPCRALGKGDLAVRPDFPDRDIRQRGLQRRVVEGANRLEPSRLPPSPVRLRADGLAS